MKIRVLIFVSLMLLLTQVVFAQQQGEVQQGSNSPAPESNQITQPQQGLQNSVQESQKVEKKEIGPAGENASKNEQDLDKTAVNEKDKQGFIYDIYNSFGLNISSHSGMGLSYRYHMNNPMLFQISGGVISEGKSFYYAVGAELQRELSKVKDKRAFAALAMGIYGNRYKETYYAYYTGMNPPEKWQTDNYFSMALGVGGELAFGNSLVDSISIGCEIYPVGMYIGNKEDSFTMTPGGSIYLFYNF